MKFIIFLALLFSSHLVFGQDLTQITGSTWAGTVFYGGSKITISEDLQYTEENMGVADHDEIYYRPIYNSGENCIITGDYGASAQDTNLYSVESGQTYDLNYVNFRVDNSLEIMLFSHIHAIRTLIISCEDVDSIKTIREFEEGLGNTIKINL